MTFEWHDAKAAANLKKHGISFEAATTIFDGKEVTFPTKEGPDGEARSMSIGELHGLIIIAVVHTDRHGVTRLISARPASQKERATYHDHR